MRLAMLEVQYQVPQHLSPTRGRVAISHLGIPRSSNVIDTNFSTAPISFEKDDTRGGKAAIPYLDLPPSVVGSGPLPASFDHSVVDVYGGASGTLLQT